MTNAEIASAGYLLAASIYLVLAVLLLTIWRERPKSSILALASVVSVVWALVAAGSEWVVYDVSTLLAVSELLRGVVWITLFLLILGAFDDLGDAVWSVRFSSLTVLAAATIAALTYEVRGTPSLAENILASGGLVVSISLVFLVERVFRSAGKESDFGLRYFCLAIIGLFLYDVILHGRTIIEGGRNADFWTARGFVNGALVLPVIYAVRKRFNLSVDTLLSRQIVFFSYSLTAIGILLLALFSGDYYIRSFNGEWVTVLRIFLFATFFLGLAILVVSPTTRATARVLMTKALFQYKYDYRREWLRFVGTLSQSGLDAQVPETAVKAIAQIVNSPGGAVWSNTQDEQTYLPVGTWNCMLGASAGIDSESPILKFLKDTEWVVDLEELRQHPARYRGQTAADIPDPSQNWWLVVPMMLGERLSGFIILLRPSVVPVLNFEDHDLLKTAGRHVAAHIEQAETDRRLAEESQFGAYNRLTAFLMHDLNNLIAQQSLVVENAEKFRHNPDFVDDAIGTISNSVDRMRRLMDQLSAASRPAENKRVNLSRTINSAVKRTSGVRPIPQLVKCEFDIHVRADADRLSMVIEHLLRNAQEATADEGRITISVDALEDYANISIADNGSGMTREFIQTRLFRPFDSTKGNQGMGIGVYQAREYARSLGGQLTVDSKPGTGTKFTLILPLILARATT